MKDQDINSDSSLKGVKKPEQRLKARAVSRGVAIGKLICLYGSNRQFYRIDLENSGIQPELKRLRKGIDLARRQLEKLASRKNGAAADSGSAIFDTHLLMLKDSSLQSNIEDEIINRKINAEWAIKLVTDTYVAKYKAIPDEHLRDRYIDLEDVSERLLGSLGGGRKSKFSLGKNAVIVATELKPSSLIEFAASHPKALITENGGWTSHTFIIAREINLPAVTGLKKILRRVKTGDTVIVDGYNGQIILHPEKKTLAHYKAAAAHFEDGNSEETETAAGPAKTLDGRQISVLANSDLPSVYRKAKRRGAQGIGLYRSEFLFNQTKGFPSESVQVKAYRNIAAIAGDDGVKIRTFDLSIGQLFDHSEGREKNPALGLRAVRLSLAFNRHLRTQIRALLRASFQNKIDIVLPMVSGVSEVLEFRSILQREKRSLEKKGREVGDPRIGAMIELPSAVLMVKELAEEMDFLCLGTNDLVQYLLAVDRDNEGVSEWFRTLHPAVIRAIRNVISAANEAGKPVIVCGEMAGSPYYVPILIGLGATHLSMNVNSITKVRNVISGIAFEETREMIKQIKEKRTVEEVEDIVDKHVRKNWGHLFPPDFLESLKG
ncbi:MAG: phosphoenolpyruvate--protein phosphotransferase [Saprospiraceae bacterium]|nr:phosphoenolpyruvate--protein phosphotransferase [Pyrinomonadaceae bacterium]